MMNEEEGEEGHELTELSGAVIHENWPHVSEHAINKREGRAARGGKKREVRALSWAASVARGAPFAV